MVILKCYRSFLGISGIFKACKLCNRTVKRLIIRKFSEHNVLCCRVNFASSFKVDNAFFKTRQPSLRVDQSFLKTRKSDENDFSHSVMEKLPAYTNSIIERLATSNLSEDHALKNILLVELQNELKSNSTSGNSQNFILKLSKDMCRFNNEDFLEFLKLVSVESNSNSFKWKIVHSLKKEVNTYCCNHMENFTIMDLLLIEDCFFHLGYNIPSSKEIISSLIKQLDKMTGSQFVQLLFYINLQRDLPRDLALKLETKLVTIINELNIEELGIVVQGFFKTRHGISNLRTLELLLRKAIENVSHMPHITSACFLKIFRKSSSNGFCKGNSITSAYCELINAYVPLIKKLSLIELVHLSLLGTHLNIYNPIILNAMIHNIYENISTARLKDITKMFFCISLFNHKLDNEDFYRDFIEQLRNRNIEINDYPNNLVSCLLYFAYAGKYPEDLLAKTFSQDFLSLLEKKEKPYANELAVLDYCVEIEQPNYKGPRLHPEKRWNGVKKLRGRIPQSGLLGLTFRENALLDLGTTLSLLLGDPNNWCYRHVLPYYYSLAIIFCLNEHNEAIPVPEEIKNFPYEQVLKAPPGNKWYCVVLYTMSEYLRESTQLLGSACLMRRLIQQLGYHIVEVPYTVLYSSGNQHVIDYLRDKIFK